MRAALFRPGAEVLELAEIPRPRPEPGEVLVEVAAAGVCGTDLHFLEGLLAPAREPLVLGHEVAGTVVQLGSGVRGLSPGMRVVLHYFHSCHQCSFCRSGREHLCSDRQGFLGFATNGGFAEFVAAPATSVVPLPDTVPFNLAAPLCCATTTALHAANVGRPALSESALVYGCGGVGLQLVQLLRRTCARVIAVSRTPAKLDAARELGADVVINSTRERVAEAVRFETGTGADLAFDLVGEPETFASVLASLSPGGRLVLVGYTSRLLEAAPLALIVPEIQVRPSVGSTYLELVAAVDLAARGIIDPFVHTTVPLTGLNHLLADLRAGAVVGRAIVEP